MGDSDDGDRLALRGHVRAFGAVVVLHVAGAALGRELARLRPAGRPRTRRRSSRTAGPTVWASTLSRPRCAMPITTSRAPRLGRALDGEVEHRHQHVHALDREPLLPEVGLVEELLQRLDLGEPAGAARAARSARQRLAVGAATRSSPAARRAPRGSRCARSRRPWCRSRWPGDRAATRPACRPGTAMRSTFDGIAAMTSGVRPSGPGRAPGSPIGGVPSGSRCAARWPCMRNALTSAIAAATWYSISGATGPGRLPRAGPPGVGLDQLVALGAPSCRLSAISS